MPEESETDAERADGAGGEPDVAGGNGEETGQDSAADPVIGRGPHRWDLARERRDAVAVSTLFTAQNVRDYLSTPDGRETAVEWCRETGVTRVFLETYRDRYRADRETLVAAREAFEAAGIAVSGCVTPTELGRSSTGWDPISCFTADETREHLADVFAYTASLFDEVMVDDFLFTDCECEDCVAARGDRSWGAYRADCMVEVSRERILDVVRETDPDAEVVVKFPQWYDRFQERGYVVDAQSEAFDTVWVGTETRDYDHPEWGGTPGYSAPFLMRWLGRVGGEKTSGGWFDTIGTTEDTYLEQAAGTVLGGADEMTLFAYGLLQEGPGPDNVERLRDSLPELLDLARVVEAREPWGVAAPKPPNSEPFDEPLLPNFLGMLGVPLVPTTAFDPDAPASVATPYLLGEPGCSERLRSALEGGSRLAVTEGLAARLTDDGLTDHDRAHVLETDGDPESLLDASRDEARALREHLLAPLGVGFDAPAGVALHLFGREDPRAVVQNFTDERVTALLDVEWPVETRLTVPGGAETAVTGGGIRSDPDAGRDGATVEIAPRSLVVL